MTTFDLKSITKALDDSKAVLSGVDFSGKSLKLDTEKDAQPIVDAINACPSLQHLTLTGNTLGVEAAGAIAGALAHHPELVAARFSDMFTGRMKTEIPLALSALGEGMITAGARLKVLDLSDNAFGPIGVEGLAKLLQSDVCSELEELHLNNNGLGITGGRLLAKALASRPRKLKIFIAGRNRLENDGAIALAKVFEKMETLEELAMPQNGIYHPGISALSDAFKHNPNLSTLNLNDNTIGHKGANAVANALPKLKNLKNLNFGDCLLKSKGASALAKAFKDNSVLLESVDLSHNEIGREACMEVVDALTELPDSGERLNKVVLAGNSLGGAANKKTMKDKLGASAELSDGEGSDNEYVTDSESDQESDGEQSHDGEDSDSGQSDESIPQMASVVENIPLDTSIVEEIDTDAARFLREPTMENFTKLGPKAVEVIDAHLQGIPECSSRVSALAEAALAAGAVSAVAGRTLLSRLSSRAVCSAPDTWRATDALLRGLGLIKSENKEYKIRWSLPPCYEVLASIIDTPDFSDSLRDTLKFFIHSKMATLPPEVREVIKKHPCLST